MLAAEFFEKTYQSDGSAPAIRQEPGEGSRRSARNANNNNSSSSNNKKDGGLRDFAVIVSKAYKQECTTKDARRAQHEHKVAFVTDTSYKDQKIRTKQRARTTKHSTSHSYPSSSSSERDRYRTPSKKVSRGAILDQYQPPPSYVSSCSESSPVGVVDEWVTLNVPPKQQQQKKQQGLPSDEDDEAKLLPSSGLLLENPFMLRDRYEQESLLNRELRRKVSELQAQVTTLRSNHNKSKNKKTSCKINHYYEDDSDDSEEDDGPNVSKDCSGILEECLVPYSSPEGKQIEVIKPNNASSGNAKSNNNYKTQLEESKQVIQMLFRDLKVSKQNEASLVEKLQSSNHALHRERQRSRENTKIAMKSADDVRAQLQYEQFQASQQKEVERLQLELAQAKEESHIWKQRAHLAKRASAETTSTLHQQKEAVADIGQEILLELGGEPMTQEVRKEERKIHNVTSKKKKKKEKPERLAASTTTALGESRLSAKYSRGIEKASLSNERNNNTDVATATPTLHRNLVTEQVKPPPNADRKQHNTEPQQPPPPQQQQQQQHPHSATTARISNDKSLATCSPTDNDISGLTRRRLDFLSCVSTDLSTVETTPVGDNIRSSDAVTKSKPTETTGTAPLSDSPHSRGSHKSSSSSSSSKNSQNSNTLSELMKELKASKERLQTAEEKLNQLVNTEGLLDCTTRGVLPNSPAAIEAEKSVDVVNSSDEGIEVSRRRTAYV